MTEMEKYRKANVKPHRITIFGFPVPTTDDPRKAHNAREEFIARIAAIIPRGEFVRV